MPVLVLVVVGDGHGTAGDEVRQEQGLGVEVEVFGTQGGDDVVDLGRVGTADADEGHGLVAGVAGYALAVHRGHHRVFGQAEFVHGLDDQRELLLQ